MMTSRQGAIEIKALVGTVSKPGLLKILLLVLIRSKVQAGDGTSIYQQFPLWDE